MSKLTISSISNLQSGSAITALNNNFTAVVNAIENTLSRDGTSPNYMSDELDMNSNRIVNLVAAVSDTEPVRLAEFQEGMDDLEATVQAIATTTQGYLNSTITLYDSFDDRYLGPKSSDPSTDNDGNPLTTGAIYWNTSTNIMKVWTGTQWTGVISTTSGFLLDDLGDVAITSANTGDVLRFDGSEFVNYASSNFLARANHTGTQLASTISDFTEASQDAVGAMVDTTLVYTDGTPSLGRASISGHISIPSGSNTASLSSFTLSELNTAISDANIYSTTQTDSAITSGIASAVGVSVQAYDATLAALAGITTASDKLIYATGVDTFSTTDFTSFGRSLVDDSNASSARTTLGVSIGSDVQAWDSFLDDIASLTDPGVDRLLFWDDSAGEITWLTLGANLSISGTSLNATGGGGGGGGLSDGDYGDITVSAASTVMTIDDDVVTFAKMQNVSANSVPARAAATSGDMSEVALSASQILGRGSTGDIAAITPTNGISISGTNLIPAREVLSANRTYYVRTDGSDSNTGLADTSGGAFLTIQKALDVVAALDRVTYTVTIQVGNGTYTAAGTWAGGLGSGTVILKGDTTTPSNVAWTVTAGGACAIVNAPGLRIEGFKLSTVTSGECIYVSAQGSVVLKSLDFGASAGSHIYVDGGSVSCTSTSYTVSGSAVYHVKATSGSAVVVSTVTVTLTGTPAFSGAYYMVDTNSALLLFSMTYSGSATGARYRIASGGTIETYGGALGSIPGNSAGATDSPLWIKLASDYTLTSTTAAQKLFNSPSNGTLSLPAGVYEFSCEIYLTTMSATSGNAQFQIVGGGSATLTDVLYVTDGIDSTTPLNAATLTGSASVTSSGTASMVTAGTGTGMIARIHGTFTMASAGTIIPSIALVTAAAAVAKEGTIFQCRRLGGSSDVSYGEWS